MRKGQFAMELLLVVSFSLLILIPVVALLYDEYTKNRTDVHLEHLSELTREIVYQAERIYYQGPPSRTTVQAYFPPNVVQSEVGQDYIYLELDSVTPAINLSSRVPLRGQLQMFSGPHTITLQVHDDGTPTDATDDYVLISDE